MLTRIVNNLFELFFILHYTRLREPRISFLSQYLIDINLIYKFFLFPTDDLTGIFSKDNSGNNLSKQNSSVTYAQLPPSNAVAGTEMLNDKPRTYNTKNEYFDTEMNCFTMIPVTYRC